MPRRLFDSDFFDEFIALTYLHRPAKPGVHEYICRKLLSFPEEAVGENRGAQGTSGRGVGPDARLAARSPTAAPSHSRCPADCYLNQFCFLAVDGVPSAGDMVVEFCRKSFRIAVKVYWLLRRVGA